MRLSLLLTPSEIALACRAYRRLYCEVGGRITYAEWRTAKAMLREGIAAGCFARDEHGIQQGVHLLETCRVLLDSVGLGRRSVFTVLFYPLVAHEVCSLEDIDQAFGGELSRLVENMVRVRRCSESHDSLSDENYGKLLVSLSKDIRVIICMICDRYTLLHALHDSHDEAYRLQIAEECRLLYTPIAHRLGLYIIKGEMEDMVMQYEHREVYDDILTQLQDSKADREAYIARFLAPLDARLKATLHAPYHLKGRTKSISSIWNKLKRQQKKVKDIFDLFAIRIIIEAGDAADSVTEKALCWQAYSVVTDMYTPNVARLKDWLSQPKANGYESLHITVEGPEGRCVEVQIRTQRMDDIAERGLAAHWKYKGIRSEGNTADRIMASIREVLESGAPAGELMRDMSQHLYSDEVFVFTPTGAVRRLPKGASVLDFAYSIHSDVGHHCVGAKIGHKNVKINHIVQSGDTVTVLTSPNQSPKLDWLTFAKTSKARNHIRQGLKEEERQAASSGRELLLRRLKNRKIEIDEGAISRVVIALGYDTQTAFYRDLADGRLTVEDFLAQYDKFTTPAESATVSHSAENFTAETILQTADNAAEADHQDSNVVLIGEGIRGLVYRLAGCCNPIHGDAIMGFVSVTRGLTIHRTDCSNLRALAAQYPYRLQAARWYGKSGAERYDASLSVVGRDDMGIMNNLSQVVSHEGGICLRNLTVDAADGLFRAHVTVSVNELSQLNTLIKKIKNIAGVKNVVRTQ